MVLPLSKGRIACVRHGRMHPCHCTHATTVCASTFVACRWPRKPRARTWKACVRRDTSLRGKLQLRMVTGPVSMPLTGRGVRSWGDRARGWVSGGKLGAVPSWCRGARGGMLGTGQLHVAASAAHGMCRSRGQWTHGTGRPSTSGPAHLRHLELADRHGLQELDVAGYDGRPHVAGAVGLHPAVLREHHARQLHAWGCVGGAGGGRGVRGARLGAQSMWWVKRCGQAELLV